MAYHHYGGQKALSTREFQVLGKDFQNKENQGVCRQLYKQEDITTVFQKSFFF